MKKKALKVLSVSMAFALTVGVGGNLLGTSNVFAANGTTAAANNATYNGKITFVHYDGEETKSYTSGSETLVNSHVHEGLIRQYQYNFLGWSDMPEKEDGNIQEGAKLYKQGQTLEKAFPEGFSGEKKLYGIYVRITPIVDNKPEETQKDIDFLKNGINNGNRLAINDSEKKDVDAEGTLPDTKLSNHGANAYENQDGKGKSKVVIDTYKEGAVNEIVLKATFLMNKKIALLVNKNPGEILTRTYERGLPTSKEEAMTGEKAYSHVDLVFTIDNRASMPENLYLKFKSDTWRPLYALDENYNPLNIGEINGPILGNSATAFDSLVNANSTDVSFVVKNPNKAHKIIIRAVIRTGDKLDRNADPNKIMHNNMALEAISKAELNGTYDLGINDANASNHLITIPDAVAKQLAETNGMDKIRVYGYIEGLAKAVLKAPYIAEYEFLGVPIEKTEGNEIFLGYVKDKNSEIKPDPEKKPENNKKPEDNKKPGNNSKDMKPKAPKTGDDSNLAGLGLLVAVSLVGGAVAVKRKEN